MVYNINEKPKRIYEWVVYSLQMVLSVFVATVLIAQICGTPINAALFGACVGTLIYQIITKFKSPMFISSCGATVSAVLGALAMGVNGVPNHLMVSIGGLTILAIYGIFALVVKYKGIQAINKIFPPTIVGSITIVIGINLANFLVGYVEQQGGALTAVTSTWNVLIALITMFTTALISHYGKGFIKNIPFLFGILAGVLAAVILTVFFKIPMINLDAFNEPMKWYPDLTFLKWDFSTQWSWANFGSTLLIFTPVAICALLEHYSDHKTLSNIVGVDLTVDPGLDKTLLGDGVASAVGAIVCGLPNTSYGESIGAIGFSKVASVFITTVAALTLGILSFIGPVQVIIRTIPSTVFAGCAMCLYGFIAVSGLKNLMRNQIDLDNSKNLIIISVILTVGTSGMFFITPSFSTVSLALILGVILNLILKDDK